MKGWIAVVLIVALAMGLFLGARSALSIAYHTGYADGLEEANRTFEPAAVVELRARVDALDQQVEPAPSGDSSPCERPPAEAPR